MIRRTIQVIAFLGLLMLAAACSAPYVQIPTVGSVIPTLAAGVARVGSATAAPSAAQTASAAAYEQAPVCSAAASCAALDGEQIPLGCVKKVPYTNVLVPKGTSFEVLDQSGDFTCVDSGVLLNDKEVLTCHGKQLYAFQLKLTNAACAGTTLDTGTGQCQDGYGYDASAKCCAPVTDGSAGSTTVTINLGACPLPSGP